MQLNSNNIFFIMVICNSNLFNDAYSINKVMAMQKHEDLMEWKRRQIQKI